MPSREHAADLERVLTRAAEECRGGSAWFGDGMPQALRSAIAAAGSSIDASTPDVAFVDIDSRSRQMSPPAGARRVVALSAAGLEELSRAIRTAEASRVSIARLICPIAVFDFGPPGLRVREIRHGLTAADLQRALDTTLWAGPDLKEIGTR